MRVGGKGPAVVLLHGYGETGDMWEPLAVKLAGDHTVIVPDLRGMGLSSHPSGGYDKKTQGGDIAGVLDTLTIGKADLVTHDIGNMVGYAFAAEHPDRVTKFVLMDAPLPGVGPWEEVLKSPLLWHFRFGGPDMERLVKGASESTSTVSGMNSQPIQRTSMRPHANITQNSTQDPARCIPVSSNSKPSTRTRSTTGPSLRKARWHAGAGGRWREIVRSDDGNRHARRRHERTRSRGPACRTLAHGRKSRRNDQACD